MSGAPSEIRLRLVGYTTAPMVVAPYLSRRTMAELDKAGVNYYSYAGASLKFRTGTWPVYQVVPSGDHVDAESGPIVD